MSKHIKPINDGAGGAEPTVFKPSAPPHDELVNNDVHLFVDDQNLFYDITNSRKDKGYRFDFMELRRVASRSKETGFARSVASSFMVGVGDGNAGLWQAAAGAGFTVNTGYANQKGKSKQDDAYLITNIMKTIYEADGPSTLVLVAGDADYLPPLEQAIEKGWRVEIAFPMGSTSIAKRLEPVVHELRLFDPMEIFRPD